MNKMDTEQFQREQEDKLRQIEGILQNALPQEVSYQKTIQDAMEYSLMAGGKRLRPMLLMESYYLFGGSDLASVSPYMAAIEMIHSYSLVHDDLPAMDNDEYRRGRKTTHIVYGEAMAILAGDALLNYAFETACRAFDMEGADGKRIGKALKILAQKAGIHGMAGGQAVDVESEGQQITGEKLDFIYRLKTGALIESSMMIGAVLSGASQNQIQTMESIAGKVGMAFQIQDDILDVEGSREELGKPAHSDEKNKKFTYVAWKGLEDAKKEVKRLSMEAMEELKTLHPEDPYLEMLLESLIHRKK